MKLRALKRTAAVLLGLTVLSSTVLAQTADRVVIRSLPGYPAPGRSSESVEVRVERSGSPSAAAEQPIDRYFAAVEETLLKYRIVGDWQTVIPDAPSIEISVLLQGKRIRLASAHPVLERSGTQVVTERGAEALGQRTRASVLSAQGEAFQRHRAAFDRLIELTLDHTRTRLSP
jgi:hypothetical protein